MDNAGTDQSASETATDFKALYRKIERTLDEIEEFDNTAGLLSAVLASLVHEYEEELGFRGGRLYERHEDSLVLCCVAGSGGAPERYRVPIDYPPVKRLLAEGLIIMGHGDPGFDEKIEGPIGVTKFAAIAVGEERSHAISFSIRGEIRELQLLYSLTAVRHVINMKLRQDRLEGTMGEARLIQESLLPAEPPQIAGYDIDGYSRPTEFVGGDLFDYLPLSSTLFGVAIADASGHGLPAALLARDVITGLRVGMTADLKIVKTIEKLNSVIHRSALSSKFASLFYGELETNGNFIYSNAGHTPPLLLRGEEFEQLEHGGLVLGPSPDAQYVRGYVRLDPGDTIVMYTDGLSEYEDPSGEQYGLDRLRSAIKELRKGSATEIVRGIFAAVDRFANGAPQRDDMTVVVVKRT